MRPFYEGRAKRLLRAPDGLLVQRFNELEGSGDDSIAPSEEWARLNNRTSSLLFRALQAEGIRSHFVRWVNDQEMLIENLDVIPIEMVVRNIVEGSLAERTGLDEGTSLPEPVLETYFKSEQLGYPLLNGHHILALKLASAEEIAECERIALRVNRTLDIIFSAIGVKIVDFKLVLGRAPDGQILVGDELSPATINFWDIAANRPLELDSSGSCQNQRELYKMLRFEYPDYDAEKSV